MTRKEIIEKVSQESKVAQADVEKTLDSLVNIVTEMVGSKKMTIDKGMKLMDLYKSFIKK